MVETVYTIQSPLGEICGSLTLAMRRISAGAIVRRAWALADEESETLRALHFESVRVPPPTSDSRPGEGVVGRTFSQREPIVVLDYAKWDHGLQRARQDSHSPAVIAVPLLVGGRAGWQARLCPPEFVDAAPCRETVQVLASWEAKAGPSLTTAKPRFWANASVAKMSRERRMRML